MSSEITKHKLKIQHLNQHFNNISTFETTFQQHFNIPKNNTRMRIIAINKQSIKEKTKQNKQHNKTYKKKQITKDKNKNVTYLFFCELFLYDSLMLLAAKIVWHSHALDNQMTFWHALYCNAVSYQILMNI